MTKYRGKLKLKQHRFQTDPELRQYVDSGLAAQAPGMALDINPCGGLYSSNRGYNIIKQGNVNEHSGYCNKFCYEMDYDHWIPSSQEPATSMGREFNQWIDSLVWLKLWGKERTPLAKDKVLKLFNELCKRDAQGYCKTPNIAYNSDYTNKLKANFGEDWRCIAAEKFYELQSKNPWKAVDDEAKENKPKSQPSKINLPSPKEMMTGELGGWQQKVAIGGILLLSGTFFYLIFRKKKKK